MWEVFAYFILGLSAICVTVLAVAAMYVLVKLFAFVVACIWFWLQVGRFERENIGVQFTPEQWAAWNERSERVRDDQIRRKQLFLLPPPSTSP